MTTSACDASVAFSYSVGVTVGERETGIDLLRLYAVSSTMKKAAMRSAIAKANST